MGKYGYDKKQGETLKEFALRIAEGNATVGGKSMAFVEGDYRLEYGQIGEKGPLDRMLKDLDHDLRRSRGPRSAGPDFSPDVG